MNLSVSSLLASGVLRKTIRNRNASRSFAAAVAKIAAVPIAASPQKKTTALDNPFCQNRFRKRPRNDNYHPSRPTPSLPSIEITPKDIQQISSILSQFTNRSTSSLDPSTLSFLLSRGPSASYSLPPTSAATVAKIYRSLLDSPHIQMSHEHYHTLLALLLSSYIPTSLEVTPKVIPDRSRELALELLSDMAEFDLPYDTASLSYRALIEAYDTVSMDQKPSSHKLDDTFAESKTKRVSLATWAYNLVLLHRAGLLAHTSAASKSGLWDVVSAMRGNSPPSLFTYEILLHAFAASGDPKSIRKAFLKITALSNIWVPPPAYQRNEGTDLGDVLGLKVRTRDKMVCRRETFAAAMVAHAALGDHKMMSRLSFYAKEHGFKKDRVIVNALMRSFLEQKKPHSAMRAWESFASRMSPDALTFTLLIASCTNLPKRFKERENGEENSQKEPTQEELEAYRTAKQKASELLQMHVLAPLASISAGPGASPDSPAFTETQLRDLWTRVMNVTAELDLDPLPMFLRVPPQLRTLQMVNYGLRAVGKPIVMSATEAEAALRGFVFNEDVLKVLRSGGDGGSMDAALKQGWRGLLEGWVDSAMRGGVEVDDLGAVLGNVRKDIEAME
ncbi:hypothetical protein BJ742DRAFT_795332 [Cladochytrium replicatum]|nr:hypothetical protein BJ742DRAFT_795332 [Cladochytrium replicatum]